jgi:serine/threonine-protein kinase
MGSVYLAWDQRIGREVAVKVLAQQFAKNKKHRTRFEREARAIAALRHPNIVEIYDYGGSPDQYLFLVMELIPGPNVGRLCREHGTFPESVLAAAGTELAGALHHAHQAGIIHRDLKPENVFLDRGRLVLVDFGISKAIAPENPFGAEAAAPRTDIIGTPGFMAPEQLLLQQLEARTDIFSFGALLYYLATKKLPFDAGSPYALLQKLRETRPRPLVEVRPDLSEAMSRLVHQCLEADADWRPEDAEGVRKRLRGILDDLGAGDARDILARFEENPADFRVADRKRTVAHLAGQLEIAVRDEDGATADGIRERISVLDPGNPAALRMRLRRGQRVETAPEIVLARTRRRRSRGWLLAVAAAVLTLGAVVVSRFWTR